jgi:hypothetical protein
MNAAILGVCLVLGLSALGLTLKQAITDFKMLDRSVTVKGLAENEYPADIVIWPIQYTSANNDLEALYQELDAQNTKIVAFLESKHIDSKEITLATPKITDKLAQQYGGGEDSKFRYMAVQTITVYSS